jgi:hypothetical protein
MEAFDGKRWSGGLSAQTGPLETICGGSFLICISGTFALPALGCRMMQNIGSAGVGQV